MADHVHSAATYQRLRRQGQSCDECRQANAAAQRARRAMKVTETPEPKKRRAAKTAPAAEAPAEQAPPGTRTVRYLSAAVAGNIWTFEVGDLEVDGDGRWTMWTSTEQLERAEVLPKILGVVNDYHIRVVAMEHGSVIFFLTTTENHEFLELLGEQSRVLHTSLRPEDEGFAPLVKHAASIAAKQRQTEREADYLEQPDGRRVAGHVARRGRMFPEMEGYAQPKVEPTPLPFDHPALRSEVWIEDGTSFKKRRRPLPWSGR